VKEKVAEIVRARSDSMDVLDLIERQQHNRIERQSLTERCNDVAEDHNYKTKLIARKAIIASEMRNSLKEPLSSLNAAHTATQAENRRLQAQLWALRSELEHAEFECIDLNRQLAALNSRLCFPSTTA
jgi:chromosome segregation ATPase